MNEVNGTGVKELELTTDDILNMLDGAQILGHAGSVLTFSNDLAPDYALMQSCISTDLDTTKVIRIWPSTETTEHFFISCLVASCIDRALEEL